MDLERRAALLLADAAELDAGCLRRVGMPDPGRGGSSARRSSEPHGGGAAPVPAYTAVSWSRPSQALMLFLRGQTARTAAPTALVVGTLLSVVNQGHLVPTGEGDAGSWIRVAVNYVVPYTVASIGFLSARRVRPGPPSAGRQPPADR